MASIFMRIDGLEMEGAATIKEINGKKGFFAIEGANWSSARSIDMQVGNGNNADHGVTSMNPLSASRECDGASPYLCTFMFSPGNEGQLVEIVFTKPGRAGEGPVPYLIITLEKARVCHYNVMGSDGQTPREDFSLFYSTISLVYYYEKTGGGITKGDTVKFDVTTGTLESKAALPS